MKDDGSVQPDGEHSPIPLSEEEGKRTEAERRREAEKETREITQRYRETFDKLAE